MGRRGGVTLVLSHHHTNITGDEHCRGIALSEQSGLSQPPGRTDPIAQPTQYTMDHVSNTSIQLHFYINIYINIMIVIIIILIRILNYNHYYYFYNKYILSSSN